MPNPRKKLLPFGIGRTLDRIRQEDERGLLYYMDYKANYYSLEKFVDLVTKPGCTTFLTDSPDGHKLFARNYDICHWKNNERTEIKDVTGLILVVHCTSRKAKYKSIGVVDAFWLDFKKGRFFEGCLSDGKTDTTIMAIAPLAVMDGMNEAGLAVSIMHLPTENNWTEIDYIAPESLTEDQKKTAVIFKTSGEIPKRLDANIKKDAIAINTADHKCWKADKNLSVHQKDPGKKTLLHPVLMRKMLDFCKDADEAVQLAESVNVQSPMPDNDYHILIADRSGRSYILEWVNNELKVQPAVHSTNFYLTRDDHYGYGYDRDELVAETLKEHPGGMTEAQAMSVLKNASQNGSEGRYTGFTQWSSLYDLNKGTMKLSVFMDYEKTWEYRI